MVWGLRLRERSLDSLAHVGRQSIVAGAAQLAGSFLRFGTVVLVARLVGPAALGLYVLALTLANGATVVATLGFDRAVLRFIAQYRGRQEPGAAAGLFAFSSLVVGGASVAMGSLIFLGASHLSSWLHHPELAPAARVIALALPFLTLGQMARAGLTGFQDIRLAVALEQLAMPALTALMLVALHRQRPADNSSPVVAAVVAQGAVGVIAWMVLRSRLGHQEVVAGWRIRDWVGFSFPLWLERGLLFVVVGAGYGFLARSGDTGSVAAYGAAWRVAAFVGLPLAAVASIFGPTISNLVARGDWMNLQSL